MSDERSNLPQLPAYSEAVIQSVEWLFEPAWKGDRLFAHVDGGRVTLTGALGQPADDSHAEAVDVLEPAVDVEQALIDGVWTAMPFIGTGSAAHHLAEAIEAEGLAGQVPDPIENESRRAFVAVDLLELDGQPLYDVPFLERRRVLASVIEEGARVRLSPAVRVPIHNWLAAWRASGFEHYIAKHVNSRYRPGEVVDDWLQVSTAERRGPSPVGRLWGQRPKKVVHIDDAGPEGPKPPKRNAP